MSMQINKFYQYLLLALAIILLYSKTVYFDYCIDDSIISDSLDGKVNSFNDLLSLFKLSYNNTDYRPIVFLSFGIERLLFEEFNPMVSHAVNFILYFLICLSALKFFEILFENKYGIILFFSVLLFCVHPINTEVVSSIKCRDNLLSMLFGLLSSSLFLKYYKEEKKKYLLLFIAFIFSCLSILSKLDGFGFLIFNILYAIQIKKNKKILFGLVSVLFLFSVYFMNNLFRENLMVKNLDLPLTPKVTITENPLALAFTLPNRLVASVNTVYFYFTKFTYTSSSKYYYGYNYYDVLSIKSLSFIGGLIIITGFIFAFIYSILKKEKIITISIIGIISTSIYALNFIQPVAGIIADRYIFIANLFFCLFVTYCIIYFCKNFKIEKYGFAILSVIMIVFSTVSFLRVNAWKNLKTLIDTDAPNLYNSYEAMRIASSVYMKEYESTTDVQKKNEYKEKCIFYALKGIEVYPKNYLLHQFLGQYYYKFNQVNQAKMHLYISLKNDSTKSSNFYLGDLYYSIKNLDSSLYFYKEAFLNKENSAVLINNISSVYYEMNDNDGCLKFNHDLLTKDSTIFAAHENLGYFYLNNNDTIKAIDYFKKSIKYGLDVNSLPIKIQ